MIMTNRIGKLRTLETDLTFDKIKLQPSGIIIVVGNYFFQTDT